MATLHSLFSLQNISMIQNDVDFFILLLHLFNAWKATAIYNKIIVTNLTYSQHRRCLSECIRTLSSTEASIFKLSFCRFVCHIELSESFFHRITPVNHNKHFRLQHSFFAFRINSKRRSRLPTITSDDVFSTNNCTIHRCAIFITYASLPSVAHRASVIQLRFFSFHFALFSFRNTSATNGVNTSYLIRRNNK